MSLCLLRRFGKSRSVLHSTSLSPRKNLLLHRSPRGKLLSQKSFFDALVMLRLLLLIVFLLDWNDPNSNERHVTQKLEDDANTHS